MLKAVAPVVALIGAISLSASDWLRSTPGAPPSEPERPERTVPVPERPLTEPGNPVKEAVPERTGAPTPSPEERTAPAPERLLIEPDEPANEAGPKGTEAPGPIPSHEETTTEPAEPIEPGTPWGARTRFTLAVPEPQGPLGPLSERLPDDVADLVWRIHEEGGEGLFQVDEGRVTVSLPGMIPEKRGHMAGMWGQSYDFTILNMSF